MSDEKVYSRYEQTRTSHRPAIRGKKQMVVSGHSLATQAGTRILDQGGNAVDAAVAAGLCLAVLQSDMVNFAGVAPMMIYMADTRETITIDGLGVWPRKADVAFFKTRHDGKIPDGIHRCIVPGTPCAWITALKQYGTMSFSRVCADALDLAKNGFPMHQFLKNAIDELADKYQRWEENRNIYLPNGKVPEVDELFFQKDLAQTMQRMMDKEQAVLESGTRPQALDAARDEFYKGTIARDIIRYNKENDGLMDMDDLANYACTIETPVSTRFGAYEIKGGGPWCQAPVLLEALNILENFDLKEMGHNSAGYIHTIAEALKLAFSDREKFFGDPKFVPVPLTGLLSKEYAKTQAARIKETACPKMPAFGNPWVFNDSPMPRDYDMAYDPLLPNQEENRNLDTSYVGVVDAQGNCITAIPSDMSFSGPVIPGTGMVVSTRGSQSFVDEKHASCIAGGKRPRLTPAPFMVFKDGAPFMVLGTPGGDVQCQTILQTFLNITVFGMDVQTATEQARFATFSFPNSFAPHDYHPNLLRIEARVPEKTIKALGEKGHNVMTWPEWAWKSGGVCVIKINPEKNSLAAGADPRRESYAQGW